MDFIAEICQSPQKNNKINNWGNSVVSGAT